MLCSGLLHSCCCSRECIARVRHAHTTLVHLHSCCWSNTLLPGCCLDTADLDRAGAYRAAVPVQKREQEHWLKQLRRSTAAMSGGAGGIGLLSGDTAHAWLAAARGGRSMRRQLLSAGACCCFVCGQPTSHMQLAHRCGCGGWLVLLVGLPTSHQKGRRLSDPHLLLPLGGVGGSHVQLATCCGSRLVLAFFWFCCFLARPIFAWFCFVGFVQMQRSAQQSRVMMRRRQRRPSSW